MLKYQVVYKSFLTITTTLKIMKMIIQITLKKKKGKLGVAVLLNIFPPHLPAVIKPDSEVYICVKVLFLIVCMCSLFL